MVAPAARPKFGFEFTSALYWTAVAALATVTIGMEIGAALAVVEGRTAYTDVLSVWLYWAYWR